MLKRLLIALSLVTPVPAMALDGLVACANKPVKDTDRMYLTYATADELAAVREDLPKGGVRISEILDPSIFGLHEVLTKWLPGNMLEVVAFYDTYVTVQAEGWFFGGGSQRSRDGITWEAAGSAPDYTINNIAYDGERFAGVGRDFAAHDICTD